MEMSREDPGILFQENFVLGMRLYKIIQKCRGSQSSSLTESDVESVASIYLVLHLPQECKGVTV